jgi:hypothetical protein
MTPAQKDKGTTLLFNLKALYNPTPRVTIILGQQTYKMLGTVSICAPSSTAKFITHFVIDTQNIPNINAV